MAAIAARFTTAVSATVAPRFAATITTATAALRTGCAKTAALRFGPIRHRGRTALHHRRTDPNRLCLLLRRRVLTHHRLPVLLGAGLLAGKISQLRSLWLLRAGLRTGLRSPQRSGRAAIETAICPA